MNLQILFLSVAVSLMWIGVTGHVSPGGFLVGYIIGIISLLLLKGLGVRFEKPIKLTQPLAILTYAGLILWNGLISSVKVVKLVLSPKIELRTGIVAITTGDESPEQTIAALSAHGINMTPGQLVIDFDDNGTLYVHCLNLEASLPTIQAEQTRRVHLLRRIIGDK